MTKGRLCSPIGIYLSLMGLTVFWIYRQLPANWYLPTSIHSVSSLAISLFEHAIQTCIAAKSAWAIVSLLVFALLIKRPEKLRTNHLVLFLPLLPMTLVVMWSAYCWQTKAYEIEWKTLQPEEIFTFLIFKHLNLLFYLHLSVLACLISVSSKWQGARFFGITVLQLELFSFHVINCICWSCCTGVWL